ncbi:MAG: ABC transporter ATP-binding protein [Lachnospiraceae bacterium]|nr:ABC transporter ATP-binding protein [Lachnospiraceae bacterium]
MRKLLPYLKEYVRECILAPGFKMLEACFELIVPIVIASLIDRGIGDGNIPYIFRMIVVLFMLAIVGCAVAITAQYFSAKAAIGFATKLRLVLFKHLMNLSYPDIDEVGTSTMITRMTSDVNKVQTGVNMFLRLFLRSPFVVFGAMFMAFTIDFKSALIFVIAIVGIGGVVFFLISKNIPALRQVQNRLDEVTNSTRESLTGLRVLRAFRLESKSIDDFKNVNGNYFDAQTRAGNISALMNPLTYVLINLATVGVIYLGGIKVSMGALTAGQVIALYNYMSQILVELVKLANLIVTLNRALASSRRISDILDIKPSMEDGIGSRADNQSGKEPYILFNNVSFSYPGAGEESLSDVSFNVNKGETVGVIGGTGSGKSTLVNLIPRFYDVTKGSVRIDGIDVRNYRFAELRKKVGVVKQKAVLFKGSIADNLRMGDEKVSLEDMEKAINDSQSRVIVEGKGGIEAEVEQGGRNFSGGQRQRLSIARTLAYKPDILILDDSSSALDYATDLQLRRAIRNLEYKPTVFIISQRTASIRYADKIIVLEDGLVAGIGTHDELLETCEVYREIHSSQLTGKEA